MHPVLHHTLKRALIEGGGAPRMAGNNLAYAIGDSRMSVFGSPSGSYNERYPVTVARQLLNGQVTIPYGNIGSVGGYTLQQIYDNLFATALASTARTLILLGGVNSYGTNVATNIALVSTMANAWVNSAADRVIHVLDECIWGPSWAAWDEAGHQALRDGIRALSNPANGIYIVPSWQAVTGGNDGITPLADTYTDDIHFATPGSMRVGRVLAASLALSLPTLDYYNRSPALVTSQTFVAGTLAANDITQYNSVAGPTAAMVLFEGEYWLEVTLAAWLGVTYLYRSSSTVPGSFVAGTTLLESNIDFILKAGHANIRSITLAATKQSLGLLVNSVTGAGGADGAHSGSGSDATVLSFPDGEEVRGVLHTPKVLYAADATQFKPWMVTMSTRTSLAATGVLLLKRPQCRVVT